MHFLSEFENLEYAPWCNPIDFVLLSDLKTQIAGNDSDFFLFALAHPSRDHHPVHGPLETSTTSSQLPDTQSTAESEAHTNLQINKHKNLMKTIVTWALFRQNVFVLIPKLKVPRPKSYCKEI